MCQEHLLGLLVGNEVVREGRKLSNVADVFDTHNELLLSCLGTPLHLFNLVVPSKPPRCAEDCLQDLTCTEELLMLICSLASGLLCAPPVLFLGLLEQ